MWIAGTRGVRDDRKLILLLITGRKIYGMVKDRALWRNHACGGTNNLHTSKDGNVTFGHIDSQIGRTKGKF